MRFRKEIQALSWEVVWLNFRMTQKRFFIILILILTVIANIETSTESYYILFDARLSSALTKTKTIKLSDLTSFKWNTVCIYPPYNGGNMNEYAWILVFEDKENKLTYTIEVSRYLGEVFEIKCAGKEAVLLFFELPEKDRPVPYRSSRDFVKLLDN